MKTSAQKTAKRERMFKRAKSRQLVAVSKSRRSNPFDSYGRVGLVVECAYRAVATSFAWLELEHIKNPPRRMFDAKLARQIAIHIMVHQFGIEQRLLTAIQGRQRTSIHFALQAVERRLEQDTFRATYEQMASDAVEQYEVRAKKAA